MIGNTTHDPEIPIVGMLRGPPVITNDEFIHRIWESNLRELPLNKREWYEQDVCPICKRMVYIYRHHPGLCQLIENNKRKEQKVAQEALRKAKRNEKDK